MDDAARIIFSSEIACDRIAERTVRKTDAAAESTARLLITKIMQPLQQQMYDHGKVKRGLLAQLSKSMARELANDETVVEVSLEPLFKGGALSSNEIFHLRFVATCGNDQKQWLEFVAVEALMTRREATMSVASTNFRVHRHALTRYMQREAQPLKTFFGEIIQPIRTSAILSAMSAGSSSPHLAFPMGEGLLLGKRHLFSPAPLLQMKIDSMGPHVTEGERMTFLQGCESVSEMITYVDRDGMTDSRQALWQLIKTFEEQHRETITFLFNAATFNLMMVERELFAKYQTKTEAVLADANTVVKSSVWKHFEDTVDKHVP